MRDGGRLSSILWCLKAVPATTLSLGRHASSISLETSFNLNRLLPSITFSRTYHDFSSAIVRVFLSTTDP
jgi:hypothetical protein